MVPSPNTATPTTPIADYTITNAPISALAASDSHPPIHHIVHIHYRMIILAHKFNIYHVMINEIMVDGVKGKNMMIKVVMEETKVVMEETKVVMEERKVVMEENVMIMVDVEKDMMIKRWL